MSPFRAVPDPTRRRRGFALRSSLLCLGLVLATGCYDQILAPAVESDGRLTVTNDDAALSGRVSYPDEPVPIVASEATPSGSLGAPALQAPSSLRLTLVGEVLPPSVNGDVLQATSVWMTEDDRAIVSYNVRGSTQVGALDYFTKLLFKRPQLRSSVTFNDADVNAVFTDGDWAYAATATSDTSFAEPAVLERIQLQSDKFRVGFGNDRVPLTSFAATSATSTGSVVYATSGDAGGVFAFDRSDMSSLGEYPLDDARWVALDRDNGRVVVLQGTPGRVAVFQEGSFPGGSMTLLNTFSFPGADVAESKSTVEVAGGKAFIAAGPEGVQVMCLDDGQILGSVPIPDPASLGLDPSVVVTNAVTVQGNLMFISNGEAGVYAASSSQSFESSPCDAPLSITVLGRLQFGDLQSVNHVAYRNGNLFVAAGLGGIKVVDVSNR